jgi:FlaA1/EpsC-like NDP-sugar epimerase
MNRHIIRRQILCLAGLLPVFAGIYYLAYWLRFDGDIRPEHWMVFLATLSPVLTVKCLAFNWFRVYQGWNRHVTFHDLFLLVQAATSSSVLLALSDYLLLPHQSVPRSVFLMDWGATIVCIGGLRALLRFLYEGQVLFFPVNRTPVLIAGADESGEALLRALRLHRGMSFEVVGFIAHDASKVGSCIAGVNVLGTVDETCQLAHEHAAAEVLIAGGDLPGRQIRQLVDECRRAKVPVKVLPGYEEMLSGNLAVQPRPVEIEDLLRREAVRLEMEGIRRWIDDRVVLVTGSAGSIGSEICRQLLRFAPKRLVLVDRWENGQFQIGREFRDAGVVHRAGAVHRRYQRSAADERAVGPRPAGHHLPRGCLQARAADGSQSGRGREEYYAGHVPSGQSGGGARCALFRDDLHRQGGEPDQRDGRLQADGRDVHPVPHP